MMIAMICIVTNTMTIQCYNAAAYVYVIHTVTQYGSLLARRSRERDRLAWRGPEDKGRQ